MLAVAVGTRRCVVVAPLQGRPVNAAAVHARDVTVALTAGPRDFPLVYFRSRVARLPHVVRAMTVAAGRRLLVSGRQRHAVHARFVGLDKSRRRTDTTAHVGVVQVAVEADLGFARLVDGGFLRQHRFHVVFAVAVDAARRAFDPLLECNPVSGAGKTGVFVRVALPARVRDVRRVGAGFRVLRRQHVVGAVALLARGGHDGSLIPAGRDGLRFPVHALFEAADVVAGLAIDRRHDPGVGHLGGFDPLVAVDTIHRCVRGLLQPGLVHEKRHDPSTLLHRERPVAVAGEALLGLLRLGCGRHQRGHREREQEPEAGSHRSMRQHLCCSVGKRAVHAFPFCGFLPRPTTSELARRGAPDSPGSRTLRRTSSQRGQGKQQHHATVAPCATKLPHKQALH